MEEAAVYPCSAQKINEGVIAAEYFRNLYDKPKLSTEQLPTSNSSKQESPQWNKLKRGHAAQLEKPANGLLILAGDG